MSRVGAVSKDLLLSHDVAANLVLVCLESPTVGLLNCVHAAMGRSLRQTRNDCQILKYEDEAGFSVVTKVKYWHYLTPWCQSSALSPYSVQYQGYCFALLTGTTG